ncbi:hypothetical protein CVM52_25890 [Pseudooceanicola lipolyticus]|uniref:DUF995 domain-containing protein n=1 Tax=Pseudooceanicola lipolyticus TaxID=2029104 RepID=A0A2M8IT83_9RHOB|nr:hypothetical protein [Pseudooceanicola lipolyticus]PJE32771.1 hypothetical protein CVM52_25890 [Pseudooceanicola lipolyticus]
MLRNLVILAALAAAPLSAQSTMSGEAFDAYTRGKTLFYGAGGEAYGVERYLEGRRVIWSFLDGKCKDGYWYEEAGQICFVYEDRPGDPQCWTFRESPRGLIAQFENDPGQTELYEAQDLGGEMLCHGPDVGV